VERYADLARTLRSLPPRSGPVRLVAVDGPGGSGKTTYADRLARALDGAPVVHTDDFVDSWADATGFWPRWEEQVLAPLVAGRSGRYQRYDWVAGRLAAWREVPPAPVVILEGVSSARSAVAGSLTLAVWVEAPAEERSARALLRDGSGTAVDWAIWRAQEERHFAWDRTRERADVVVDTASELPHDPTTEYVALRSVFPGGRIDRSG
jgi:uridine kinase